MVRRADSFDNGAINFEDFKNVMTKDIPNMSDKSQKR